MLFLSNGSVFSHGNVACGEVKSEEGASQVKNEE